MKYFSTGFFLKGNVEVKDIINECLSWVSTSPFTSFVPASLDMKEGWMSLILRWVMKELN